MNLHSFFLNQEGASDEDIRQLPKYRFRNIGECEKLTREISGSLGGIMTECDTETPIEHVLSAEDTVSNPDSNFKLGLFM